MKNKTLFVFGDSFSAAPPKELNLGVGWTEKIELSEQYSVWNMSVSGASNHNIFLEFVRHVDQISPEDAVVICWSDNHRPFYSDLEKNVSNTDLAFTYQDYFFDKHLADYQSRLYLNEIQRFEKERNLRLLFMWAFPSSYSQLVNWIDMSFSPNVEENGYTYSHEFTNEVRPNLMHISRTELYGKCKTVDQLLDQFTNERRPNHIGNKRIHDTIFKIVDDFVLGKATGKFNLMNRLING
jgi:hypothetical protein